ncbi:MAG: hypothetical protein D6717_14565 [Gammaproteobacteria bacterium]|nr:MAG: hypothetical protein D6717_14565 [Gammaproteobacteria bacterium]
MKNPPIARCRDWTDCLVLLSEVDAPVCDTALADERLQHVAGVSVAWYLHQSGLDEGLPDTPALWVIGAERLDAEPGPALASMLDLDAVQTTRIGPELAEGQGSCRGTLDDCAVRLPLPDLALCLHPGLELHPDLIGPGMARLLEARVPVIGASYSMDEYERDAWVAGLHGLRLSAPVQNPWALDPGNTGLEWAGWLWHVEGMRPEGLIRPDAGALEDVRLLSEMVAHSRLSGLWPQPAPPGSSFMLPQQNGGHREMIHVFDGYYLDPERRQVYAVEGGRLVPTDTSVPAELVDVWPRGREDMPRALWAARVKRLYLLQRG